MTTQRTDRDAMRERVRARYAAAATQVAGGQSGCGCGQPADCGCDSGCCGPVTVEQSGIGAGLYADSDRDALPDAAVLPAWAAATRPPWPSCATARRCSTWAPGAASTWC